MNTAVAGLVTGLALGFAGYFGGFGAFIVVAALGLGGLIVGYLARGGRHVSDFVHTRGGDRHNRGGQRRRETFERPRSDYGPAPRTEYRSRVR